MNNFDDNWFKGIGYQARQKKETESTKSLTPSSCPPMPPAPCPPMPPPPAPMPPAPCPAPCVSLKEYQQ